VSVEEVTLREEKKSRKRTQLGPTILQLMPALVSLLIFTSIFNENKGFAAGGPLLSSLVLAFVSFQTYVTSHFVLETCARAEALEWLKQHDNNDKKKKKSRSSSDDEEEDAMATTDHHRDGGVISGKELTASGENKDIQTDATESTKTDDHEDDDQADDELQRQADPGGVVEEKAIAEQQQRIRRRPSKLPRSYSIEIRCRKFEISVLNRMFLGRIWAWFFAATTALDLYGITWAFCTIFASSLADQLPILKNVNGGEEPDDVIIDNYHIYVGIFLLVALPLSCTSILDQLYVQMAFLCARLFMFLLMVSTLIPAYYHSDRSYFGDQVGPAANDLPLCNWRGIVQAVQTAIFSTAYQFSVPAVGNVSKNKTLLRSIFLYATGFVFAANLVLSLMTSIYFGNSTNRSSNLNWLRYHGGTLIAGGDEDESYGGSGTWWSKAISGYVVVFAAVDGVAVYPLIALTLGDIIMGAVYGDNVHQVEKDWKLRSCFRLLASVPQALCAMFVRDLGDIALYAGIFTVLSYTVCPSLLCIKSQERMREEGHPASTYYSSTFLSSITWAHVFIGLSVLVVFGVILDGVLVIQKL